MIDTTTVRVSFTGSATLSDRLGRRSFEAWLFRKFFIQAIQIALHTQLGFHFCIHPTVFRNVGWKVSSISSQFFSIYQATLKSGLVDGKELAADGTYLPANVSKDSWMDTEVEAELSMQSYLDRLDEELSKQPGFKRPPAKTIRKRRTTSKTDPDSGCINHGKKSGIGYLMETTVDCKYGIITGVDVYPANEKECHPNAECGRTEL